MKTKSVKIFFIVLLIYSKLKSLPSSKKERSIKTDNILLQFCDECSETGWVRIETLFTIEWRQKP
ncbi:hypothetical protein D9V87_03705 [Bacteroidetes/Chlorobi group bacterium MS-B_bin-24]|nr:MAG: hypothetical protein D9V87_03705 [Bacteroidetes/Chlorobi group bacterium MS-B_bin-24]